MAEACGAPCLSHSVSLRTMKLAVTFCILSLLLTACRHAQPEAQHFEPEKRSTEAEIRQHIVGEWACASSPGDCWYPRLIVAADGSMTGVETNGTRVLIGKWEIYGHALRVTPTPERLRAARAAGYLMNEWDYFPVIYADDHELVMTPGISVAGRWRYKR
jgi:hypothetical protein